MLKNYQRRAREGTCFLEHNPPPRRRRLAHWQNALEQDPAAGSPSWTSLRVRVRGGARRAASGVGVGVGIALPLPSRRPRPECCAPARRPGNPPVMEGPASTGESDGVRQDPSGLGGVKADRPPIGVGYGRRAKTRSRSRPRQPPPRGLGPAWRPPGLVLVLWSLTGPRGGSLELAHEEEVEVAGGGNLHDPLARLAGLHLRHQLQPGRVVPRLGTEDLVAPTGLRLPLDPEESAGPPEAAHPEPETLRVG